MRSRTEPAAAFMQRDLTEPSRFRTALLTFFRMCVGPCWVIPTAESYDSRGDSHRCRDLIEEWRGRTRHGFARAASGRLRCRRASGARQTLYRYPPGPASSVPGGVLRREGP